VLDASCEVAWESVCLCNGKVHVFGTCWRVKFVEWMLNKVRRTAEKGR
jgi:hypothetical protein